MRVDLTNKTNWQQTNRENRYKYTGDNGEDGRHLEGGGDNHKDRGNRSRCDTYSTFGKYSDPMTFCYITILC